MSEIVEQRNNRKRTIVQFVRKHNAYQPGDTAGFTPAYAAGLVKRGIAIPLGATEVGQKLDPKRVDAARAAARVEGVPEYHAEEDEALEIEGDETPEKYNGMTAAELRTELDARGIVYDSKAKKETLVRLLREFDEAAA